MYRVIGQNVSVQHVQEDTGDESPHHHEMPRDWNTFLQGLFTSKGFYISSFFFKRDMFTRQVGLSWRWGKLANCEVLQESLGQTAT